MLLSIVTMLCTIGIGVALGVIAGYFRGVVDEVIMRVCDMMLSFPSEVMILAIVGMLGTGIFNIVIATIIAKWAWYVRMVRGIVIRFMDKNDIRFARVAGCSTGYIIRKHLIKGAFGEIAVLATLDTGAIILNISALSFLGLGVQPPTAEWGHDAERGQERHDHQPRPDAGTGDRHFLVVAAFNFLGDGIEEAMNPKLDKGFKRRRRSIFARKKAVVS